MKIVIPGGTGQLGAVLNRAFSAAGHEVVVLTRTPRRPGEVRWDGARLGAWAAEVDGADVVINLAGRSVSCRYTPANLRAMMDSRVDSARVVGRAIAAADRPPALWLQMSTATYYAHRYDAPNDEATGERGGGEPGVPAYWGYSIAIAEAWEAELDRADTPATRKVALRTAMVMSPDRHGTFDVLSGLARFGLGGPVAGGAQYVSWIHDRDFVRALRFLIDRPDLSGPVNLAAPEPLPHAAFMRQLRAAWHVPVGLPATRWMAELGAFALRTDTELLLKSRRVVPGRLLGAGFSFDYPRWAPAAADLARRARAGHAGRLPLTAGR
ncbi:TIGR01777 family oxidoreductase [Kitasatospora sp. NPDC006697]|uniref:TIGR01777 family oxidoreductase n=1 Tax=Kitasatospora sp. NPDC006697 TaxID=3364020 RepID=UPI00368E1D4D